MLDGVGKALDVLVDVGVSVLVDAGNVVVVGPESALLLVVVVLAFWLVFFALRPPTVPPTTAPMMINATSTAIEMTARGRRLHSLLGGCLDSEECLFPFTPSFVPWPLPQSVVDQIEVIEPRL